MGFEIRDAHRPPEWCSGLRHCIAVLAVPLEILGWSPGSVTADRDRETHGAAHTWPSAVWVRGGFGRQRCPCPIAHLRLLWWAGRSARWHGHQMYGVSFHTLVRLASGLSAHCVMKQCGLVGLCFGGRMALDLRLSRVCTGVAVMRQDCNYQLDTTKLGRKRGKK